MQHTSLIPLNAPDAADPAVCGGKFAGLARAARHADVPPAWCIPAAWFEQALGAQRRAELTDLFARIRETAANELADLYEQTHRILCNLDLTTPMRHTVDDLLAGSSNRWAVRSSSSVEDGQIYSHAGLYDSFLDLDAAQVCQAVLACWKSFYSAGAIMGRLRTGDLAPDPRMAVILQHMVDADLAGVAFSLPDRTTISAVIGTGEGLVSGREHGCRYEIATGDEPPPPYDQVAKLATTITADFDHQLDMEWAWRRSGLSLLQARPITAPLAADHDRPRFAAASLYFEDELPPTIDPGDCAGIYAAMTAKRSELFRRAREHGIPVDDGWVLTFNGAGLTSTPAAVDWWSRLEETCRDVVVDAAETIRQNIIPTADLHILLAQLFGLDRDPRTTHTVLIRPFRQGDAGAVSRSSGDQILVEHSTDGLLAINRGLARTERSTWAEGDRPSPAGAPTAWPEAAMRTIAEFTRLVDRMHPGACLEWILSRNTPQLIDYSAPNLPAMQTTDATVLSPGTARGPLMRLDPADNDVLARLSVAPIVSVNADAPVPESRFITHLHRQITQYAARPVVHAPKPYVILARIAPHVAGFIFDQGSTLCHLAILLREVGVPAAVAEVPATCHNGETVLLDNTGVRTFSSTCHNPDSMPGRGAEGIP